MMPILQVYIFVVFAAAAAVRLLFTGSCDRFITEE